MASSVAGGRRSRRKFDAMSAAVVVVAQHVREQRGVGAEDLRRRDRRVGDRRHRAPQRRPERAGPELDAEGLRAALEHACPAPGMHAPGGDAAGLDDQVHVRMRQRLLHLRRLALEVPAHRPEMLDAVREVVRRLEAAVRELAARKAMQHAARLGAQRASRFSNHRHGRAVSMAAGRTSGRDR
jgi:hypothetical protein